MEAMKTRLEQGLRKAQEAAVKTTGLIVDMSAKANDYVEEKQKIVRESISNFLIENDLETCVTTCVKIKECTDKIKKETGIKL